MKPQLATALKRTAVIVLPILVGGCTPQASSGATAYEEMSAFIGDFARQVLTALLL